MKYKANVVVFEMDKGHLINHSYSIEPDTRAQIVKEVNAIFKEQAKNEDLHNIQITISKA